MGSTSPLTMGKRGREEEREQRFFLVPFLQFVSPLAMAHNDVGETGLKRALNLIWARTVTCCHLQHISKLNCIVCISFIRTLGTHNKRIIELHHVTHTHSISAHISLIVKSRREMSLFLTRSNSFTNCASRVTSTVLHGWCIACLYT